MNLEEPTPEWHAKMRRRDQEDIANGVRTPEQANQDNARIPHPAQWTLVNLFDEARLGKKSAKVTGRR